MSNIDMSLSDFISKNKISTRNKNSARGNRGGGRRTRGGGRGRGGTRGQASASNRNRTPNRRGFRNAKSIGNVGGGGFNMYYGRPAALTTSAGNKPSKLSISNLEFGVTDADLKELFSEFGMLRSSCVHYNRAGRSLGTAYVVFERRTDALKAVSKYNGVYLDGRPMRIEIEGGDRVGNASVMNGTRLGGGVNVKRLQGGPKPIGGRRAQRGGGAGRGRGKGESVGGKKGGKGDSKGRPRKKGGQGRGTPKKVPTAAELDAELEEYASQATK
ncbi:UNVERIFIED_CONTAM: hypothetical protein RMT77_001830 [Armadillidium vulgare]